MLLSTMQSRSESMPISAAEGIWSGPAVQVSTQCAPGPQSSQGSSSCCSPHGGSRSGHSVSAAKRSGAWQALAETPSLQTPVSSSQHAPVASCGQSVVSQSVPDPIGVPGQSAGSTSMQSPLSLQQACTSGFGSGSCSLPGRILCLASNSSSLIKSAVCPAHPHTAA